MIFFEEEVRRVVMYLGFTLIYPLTEFGKFLIKTAIRL